jgi:hypothetical protein
MRHITLAFLVLIAGCGNEGNGMDMSMDMPAPDLNMQDMTMPPDFAGVDCGNTVCDTATQECCAMLQGTMLSGMCVPKGQCNGDAGAVIQCDGPEDCMGLSSSSNAGCCVTLGGQVGNPDAGTSTGGNGSSMCTNSCPGSGNYDFTSMMFSATTKLCHTKADCAGYQGMLLGSPSSFGSCCQAAMLGAYTFCFNAQTAGMIGGNCNL